MQLMVNVYTVDGYIEDGYMIDGKMVDGDMCDGYKVNGYMLSILYHSGNKMHQLLNQNNLNNPNGVCPHVKWGMRGTWGRTDK